MSPPPDPTPEAIFAYFLARREAGESATIDDLCRHHPQHEDVLRRLWAEHRRAERLVGEAVPGGTFFGRRLREPPPAPRGFEPGRTIGDFRLIAPIAQGGMGQVWEAEQLSLHRTVALKTVRSDRTSPQVLELFAREARAGGRLNHPGIVTVHAHGESEGVSWIALELIEGTWTLGDSLDELRSADTLPDGYYRDVARFVAEVADAIGTAHAAGVIHRDLKPRNILITPDDHPKVTDFGLAKITDETALSMTGDFLGTYAYMSPEQAAAKRMGIDHRTDVFSLGVVMYEMLALRRPFEGDTPAQITEQILTYDPPDLAKIRSGVPRDLTIICGKALEKRRDERYATASAMADELRRWLANEPILAQAPGPVRRFRKWRRRHPVKSAVYVASIVVLLVIAAAGHFIAGAERREREAISRNLDERLAEAQVEAIDDLWPIHPDEVRRMDAWLELSHELVRKLPAYEAELRELDRSAAGKPTEPIAVAGRDGDDPYELQSLKTRRRQFEDEVLAQYDDAIARAAAEGNDARAQEYERWRAIVEAEILWLDGAIPRLERRSGEPRTSRFADTELERRYARLWTLVDDLRELARPGDGGIAVVQERKGLALELRERTLDAHADRWTEARASIRDPERCPLYRGLDLSPQMGLVPLRRDASSGLWEFWHVLSGEEPRVDPEGGEYEILPDTGIVLVLIPGGTFHMGASMERDDPNYCAPNAFFAKLSNAETPVHQVTIDAYLLSKYELTQDQWWRLTETLPSEFFAGFNLRGNPTISRTNPVEHVSWYECRDALARWRLEVPTEAQWERAARAGLQTASWVGEDFGQILSKVNFLDSTLEAQGFGSVQPVDVTDGYVLHAPVDRFPPNPWGLYSITGNVKEWTRDWHGASFYELDVTDPSTGEHMPEAPHAFKGNRGGGFRTPPGRLRVSHRFRLPPSHQDADLGVRPSRPLDD